jgi:hypothetical protein
MRGVTLGDAPSPGERLLYALGQLYRRWRRGLGAEAPGDVDVWEVAGFIGIRPDIEFISEDFTGMHVHFADEVLCVNRLAEFPWQLMSVWEWAFERELADLWLEGGFD